MKRWAVLAIALLLLPAGQVFASDATPTPRVDCTGMDAYVTQMQDAVRDYLALLDQRADFSVLSPDQFRQLAADADAVASAYRAIEPPEVAQAFHERSIEEMQRWANYLRDSATLGFIAAAIIYYGDRENSDVLPVLSNPYQSLLAQRCEAFQPFVVWLNTYPNAPTAPAASPAR